MITEISKYPGWYYTLKNTCIAITMITEISQCPGWYYILKDTFIAMTMIAEISKYPGWYYILKDAFIAMTMITEISKYPGWYWYYTFKDTMLTEISWYYYVIISRYYCQINRIRSEIMSFSEINLKDTALFICVADIYF
jgi:hypothetical protein